VGSTRRSSDEDGCDHIAERTYNGKRTILIVASTVLPLVFGAFVYFLGQDRHRVVQDVARAQAAAVAAEARALAHEAPLAVNASRLDMIDKRLETIDVRLEELMKQQREILIELRR